MVLVMFASNVIENKGVIRLPGGHLFCFIGKLKRNCLLRKSGHRNSNEYLYGTDNNQSQLTIPSSLDYVSFENDHKL